MNRFPVNYLLISTLDAFHICYYSSYVRRATEIFRWG